MDILSEVYTDPFEKEFAFARPGEGSWTRQLQDAGAWWDEKVAEHQQKTASDGRDFHRMIDNVIPSAFKASRLSEHSFGEINSREAAIDNRIETVKQATGMELQNPYRGGYSKEARERLLMQYPDGAMKDRILHLIPDEAVKIFNEQVDLASERFPQKADALQFYQSIEQQAINIRNTALQQQKNDESSIDNPAMRFIGNFVGSSANLSTDPMQIAGMFLGGGTGAAKNVVSRIAQVALREAAINAGLTGATEFLTNEWKGKISEEDGYRMEAGLKPALENIAISGLFGGVVGGAIQGGREWKSARKIIEGTATIDEAEKILKDLHIDLPQEEAQIVKLVKDAELEKNNILKDLPGNAAVNSEALESAMRNAASPDLHPPAIAPIRPIDSSKKMPTFPDIRDEASQTSNSFRLMDRMVAEERINPLQIETDAVTFQYKEGSDGTGVTDRLSGVQAIAPLSTGRMLVFERMDGTRVVADGHQRAGLFKRLADETGEVPIAVSPGIIERGKLDVPAFIFREKDGWNPADVRAVAAIKNIQEGSGSLLDTARILRDRPDLFDATLSVARGQIQQATGLAALSDDAWRMVTNGLIEPHYASLAGRIAHDKPELHTALLRELIEQKPPNIVEAQFLLHDALNIGFRKEVQETLFGQLEMTQSLLAERRQIYGQAIKKIRSNKALFSILQRDAGEIEAAGNQLNRANNAKSAEIMDELVNRFEKIATRAGPVSDMLNKRALEVAGGKRPNQAAEEFVSDLVDKIKNEGQGWLYAENKLKPSVIFEPASKEAESFLEQNSQKNLEAIGQGNMFSDTPTDAKIKIKPDARLEDHGEVRAEFLESFTKSCRD